MENQIYVAAYTRPGAMPDKKSVHLALRKKDGWHELNFGIGVLFAEADYESGETAGVTRVLEQPQLYRLEDGSIGVAAQCYGIRRTGPFQWERTGGAEESGTVWITKDLVSYRKLTETEAAAVRSPMTEERVCLEIGDETVSACILPITESESEYLEKKLGEVRNVSADSVEVHIPAGESLGTLPMLKAHYSDGSVEEIPVEWNREELAAIPFDKEGSYTVTGRAVVKDYGAPMLDGVADPMIRLYNGKYYLVGTNEFTEGRDLYIRCAETIDGLAEAEKKLIFKATQSGDHSGCNWAPELHIIGGRLCCLLASSLNGDWKHVQSRFMYCDGDPMEIGSWSEPVRVCKANGENLIEDGITLDMTCFEAAGKSYYCWAQRTINERGIDSSDLMIAQVNPDAPQRILGEAVLLHRPKYAWDRQNTEVDEGPFMLKHDGKLFLSFSGDAVGDYYCLGWLIAEEDGDLLNPESWKEVGYPVLGREHAEVERGPGHNSFTVDEYGRDVIAYHAKPNGGMRSAYARTIHYGFDGMPLLYLTPERFLKPEFREVTAKVVIEKPAYLFVHFREKTTPDGEQVYFGLSKDGFHWEEVYGGQPLLWAYYGDKGVRDFTVTRCENNGKYYIFATDLSLSYGMRGQYHHSWEEIGRNGSRCLSVWESEDLVNWSEQRLVKLGGAELGCRWAPDILRDKEHGDYILHWSSPHESDGYREKAIFYSRTKDFKEFTAPALLYRKEDSGVIDSAMYEEDGKYYLFVKSEKNPCGVILLQAEHATGPFTRVEGFEESMGLENAGSYEAPAAVRLADGRWCLFLDYFGVRGKGQGYVPFVADKLEGGRFTRSDAAFSFPYGFKHGTIIKIAQSDYERIRAFDWSEPVDLR